MPRGRIAPCEAPGGTGRGRNDEVAIYFASHDGQDAQDRRPSCRAAGFVTSGADLADLSVTRRRPTPGRPRVARRRHSPWRSPARRAAVSRPPADGGSRPAHCGHLGQPDRARKPGQQTVEGNVYLRNWLKRTGLRPALAAAVPGRLDYPAYRWFDRMMLQAIMRISGRPHRSCDRGGIHRLVGRRSWPMSWQARDDGTVKAFLTITCDPDLGRDFSAGRHASDGGHRRGGSSPG